jgi:DNA topoisomerase I
MAIAVASLEGLRKVVELHDEPKLAARAAGLRYVNPNGPGIVRVKAGKSFSYFGVDGRPVRDKSTLERIRALAIPPAWRNVWVSPIDHGHLQAVGRDARGRRQYCYHKKWRSVRDEAKYGHTIAFARALPGIRRRIRRDLAVPGLPREKVLAAVVRLLETTLIRVGNDEYARENNSFGLTTMRDRHAKIKGSRVEFTFVGKSGKRHTIDFEDARLAHIVKRCRDIPGYDLFQYFDQDGERRSINSADVNDYLRRISGQDFTAKDFRTWAGTVLAATALQAVGTFESEVQAKHNLIIAIESVSERLGNTPTICRKCYVHPDILSAYMDGELIKDLAKATRTKPRNLTGLHAEEAAVLVLLEKRRTSEVSTRHIA